MENRKEMFVNYNREVRLNVPTKLWDGRRVEFLSRGPIVNVTHEMASMETSYAGQEDEAGYWFEYKDLDAK